MKSPLKIVQNITENITFIEVMIVVAIIAILTAVALPAYHEWSARNDGHPTYKERQQQNRVKNC